MNNADCLVFCIGVGLIVWIVVESKLIPEDCFQGRNLQELHIGRSVLDLQDLGASFTAEEELRAVDHFQQVTMRIIRVSCRGEECLRYPHIRQAPEPTEHQPLYLVASLLARENKYAIADIIAAHIGQRFSR